MCVFICVCGRCLVGLFKFVRVGCASEGSSGVPWKFL